MYAHLESRINVEINVFVSKALTTSYVAVTSKAAEVKKGLKRGKSLTYYYYTFIALTIKYLSYKVFNFL